MEFTFTELSNIVKESTLIEYVNNILNNNIT